MVTNTEASGYVSSIEWSEEGVQLKEFARKYKLPTVGRVVKGHYEGIGVPSLSCPSSRQTAFWLNGGKVVKVAAQCVKFKESRGYNGLISSRPIPFGPKLAIPDNYAGFFEILSEEGRSVKCIESVSELIKRSPSTSVLIRETVKVYLPKSDNENIVSDKSRSLAIGEVLTLANPSNSSDNLNNNHLNGNNNKDNNTSKSFSSTATTPTINPLSSPCDTQINNNSGSSVSTSDSSSSSTSSSPSPMSSTCSSTTGSLSLGVKLSPSAHCQVTTSSSSSQSKYIKCYTSKGETVYLHIEGKGRFSPIAKEESISGVHRITSLLTKRLPLMVRLVFGRPPAGFKSFTPEMRLFSIFSEDYLMALPVTKESASVVTIPLSASLKIVGPKNGSFLSTHRHNETLLNRFNDKTSGCPNSLLPNRIQICEGSSLGKGFKNNWKEVNPGDNSIEQSVNSVNGITVTSESVKYNHKKRLFQSDSIELIGEKNNNKINVNNTSSGSDKSKNSCDSETMGIDDEPTIGSNGATDVESTVNKVAEGGIEEDEDDDDDSCYDEIDQIYDYVRGFAPLPEKLRPRRPSKDVSSSADSPPEPPPIETIPSLGHHHGHHGHSSGHHYPSGYRRLSYPTVFHEIIPKSGLCEKKISPSDHIYEKVPVERKCPEKRYHSGNLRTRDYHQQQSSTHHPPPSNHLHGHRIPMRSNSTGKMYLPLNGLPINPHPQQQQSNPNTVNHHHQPNLSHHQQPHNHNHGHHHHHQLGKPKLFIKSNQPQTQTSFHNGLLINVNPSNGHHGNRKTSKLMRYAKGLSLGNENTAPYYTNNNNENDKNNYINQNNSINNSYHVNVKVNDDNNNKWTFRSTRSLTTSPLFNIRYKSLTNLHFITPMATSSSSSKGYYDHHSNNTLASSSNSSGCKISSGSGRSVESPSDNITKAKKTRKLSRPLSFSNLFWDLKNDLISSSSANRDNNVSLESMYPDQRISSSPNGGDSSAMVLTQLVNNVASNRRVGTLYL